MNPATGRTLAQAYCLLVGLVLVVAGIAGFFVDSSFGTAHDGHGELLGFMVNGWHNCVHLASGLLLLVLHGNAPRARAGAFFFAVAYGAVFVWGVITGDSVAGIIAVNDADQILHAALAGTALLSALASPLASDLDKDATASRLTIYEPGRPPAARPLPTADALPAGAPSRPQLPARAPRRARPPGRARAAARRAGRRSSPRPCAGCPPRPTGRARARGRGRGGCARRRRRRGPSASIASG